MKKQYSKPIIEVYTILSTSLLQGSGVYNDDPQDPGNALGRQNDFYFWIDEEEEKEDIKD